MAEHAAQAANDTKSKYRRSLEIARRGLGHMAAKAADPGHGRHVTVDDRALLPLRRCESEWQGVGRRTSKEKRMSEKKTTVKQTQKTQIIQRPSGNETFPRHAAVKSGVISRRI